MSHESAYGKISVDMKVKKRSALLVSMATMFVIVGLVHVQKIARADAPSVVINEIMYNPLSDLANDDFLELYNPTADTIDLSGWCFSTGITICFSPGTTISSHGYGVISPNAGQTLTTYGITTIGTYTGALSNGGEQLKLVDASSQTVVDFTYDDSAPWPSSPDGTGPSLELINPDSDVTQANAWSASIDGATPGAINSTYSSTPLSLPEITNLSTPQDVAASDTPVITVNSTNATSVSLTYKVMFEAEQTVVMNDDGASGDESSGDGIYSLMLPVQNEGTLIRYYATAENDDGEARLPGNADTINYKGYVVQDESYETQLPILQWFIKPDELEDMRVNHSHDDQEFDCVVAYGNTVIDNAKVHIKGQTTRNLPKKAFAIDLPKGHKLQMADMTRAVDEFHLNSTALDSAKIVDVMAWKMAEEIGMPTTQMFKMRLQHNGDFYGLYTFAEEYDGAWRDEFNYSTGSFYKGGDKKTREDIDDGNERNDWNNTTAQNPSPERDAYVMDNQNVPNIINTMAFEVFIRNWDWTFGKNMITYRDHADTGRWSMLPYDLDGAFEYDGPGQTYMTPFDMPRTQGSFNRQYRGPALALYDDADFRKIYFRRLRTLYDQFVASGWLESTYQQQKNLVYDEFVLDYQKWQPLADPEHSMANIQNTIDALKKNYTVRYSAPWAVPMSQSTSPVVDIETVQASSMDPEENYVILKNNSNETIDMSSWHIPELNFTLPLGSGLAPGQSGVIPRKDVKYRAANPGSYVLGQLSVDIPIMGTLHLNRANNTSSAVEVY